MYWRCGFASREFLSRGLLGIGNPLWGRPYHLRTLHCKAFYFTRLSSYRDRELVGGYDQHTNFHFLCTGPLTTGQPRRTISATLITTPVALTNSHRYVIINDIKTSNSLHSLFFTLARCYTMKLRWVQWKEYCQTLYVQFSITFLVKNYTIFPNTRLVKTNCRPLANWTPLIS